MLEVTRLTPRICSVEKIIIETIRHKYYSKGEIIHRLMKEQKQCFGALLETKSQKTKRIKLEKKGRIAPKIAEPNVDSELSWMLKNSNLRYVKIHSSPVVKSSILPPVPEKVVLVKTKKHEQASLDAAEGVLSTLQKGTRPSKIDKKITKTHALVQKRIIQRTCAASKLENANENPKATIISQPDDVKKNLDKNPLYYEEEENCPNIWNSKQILSISRTADEEYSLYPSVTRILNATMSEEAKKLLERWMAKMIKKLGQEGFDAYKTDLLENGKLLHSAIDMTLRKKPVEVPLNLKTCYDSMKSVLKEVKNVRAIESHVVHRDLRYRGVVDCVASYQGNICVIDWKKSDKPKLLLSSTYDAPLQIASYIGALNADKNYPFQIKSGLLVIAYSLGDKPTVHPIVEKELQYYWKQWLERLKKYHAMQNT